MAQKSELEVGAVISPDRIQSIQHEDYRRIYSNSVKATVTPWDIQYTFGEVQGTERGGTPTLTEMITIIASPPQAKAFVKLLSQMVSDYEARFGPIGVPSDLVNPHVTKPKA